MDSTHVVFVVDQSGSMGGGSIGETELDTAVKSVIEAVSKLPKGARVNVIFFETNIHVWAKKLVKMNKQSFATLKKYLLRRQPRGSTNLYDALELALKYKDVDTIYVLSDGSPNMGKFTSSRDIRREIRKINEFKRVVIHAVAVGYNSALLKALAAENGGRYVQK